VAYLLDANVFIQAKNLHYSFDFCPAFWDWIETGNQSQTVFSIGKVRDEILAGADELAQWATQYDSKLFLESDDSVVASLRATTQWASRQSYIPSAVSTFLQSADYYLIAHAHANSHVVVTHEIAGNSLKRIKIPDVCRGLRVKCITPFQMLRIEKARFILGPRAHATV
jgi:hypothetical protein